MFKATTPKLQELVANQPALIQQLERLLVGRVNMYIDFANVRHWAGRLGWHIDLERLQVFLRSFDNIASVGFYHGTLLGDAVSERTIENAKRLGYRVRTKPVKIMRHSIDVSSISTDSPALLKQFIRSTLLRKLDIKTIEYLNLRLQELNKMGLFYLEDRKCNFDVEIGTDMRLSHERNEGDCFVLWSGDSDFHDPIKELLTRGRKVILFATARRVSSELNSLKRDGLFIFDIAKLRKCICYNRELRA